MIFIAKIDCGIIDKYEKFEAPDYNSAIKIMKQKHKNYKVEVRASILNKKHQLLG